MNIENTLLCSTITRFTGRWLDYPFTAYSQYYEYQRELPDYISRVGARDISVS